MGSPGSVSNLYDSTIGEITGSNRVAEASMQAAKAQERAQSSAVAFAAEGLSDAREVSKAMNRNIDSAIADATSPQELNALMASLQQQATAVDRQAELFKSLDPAIMEASQQALSILRGDTSAQSSGIARRRAGDREKLVARLREQLGPGAETSTAGIQALSKFDSETEDLQQNSLGQLFGMAQAGAQGRSAMNQGTANLANIGGMFGARGNRLAQTQLQGAGMQMNAGNLVQNAQNTKINAQQGLAAASGSQFVGEQLRGQAQNQFVNDRIQAGEQMASQAVGSYLGCFPEDEEIRMEDGSLKAISEIELGDEIYLGGRVTKTIQGLAEGAQWYDYQGVTVTGTHAVREFGRWIRVSDSELARPLDIEMDTLYNLSTENHVMVIRDVIFSDFDDVDDTTLSYQESLEAKNA